MNVRYIIRYNTYILLLLHPIIIFLVFIWVYPTYEWYPTELKRELNPFSYLNLDGAILSVQACLPLHEPNELR